MEVAEQFISLNDTNAEYKVTGILNAPAFLASRQSENAGWLNLAEQLGRIISKIANEHSLRGASIKISLIGNYTLHYFFKIVISKFLIIY